MTALPGLTTTSLTNGLMNAFVSVRSPLLLPQLSWIEMLDANYGRLRPGTRRSKVVARRLVHQRNSSERESFHRACWKAWRKRLKTTPHIHEVDAVVGHDGE